MTDKNQVDHLAWLREYFSQAGELYAEKKQAEDIEQMQEIAVDALCQIQSFLGAIIPQSDQDRTNLEARNFIKDIADAITLAGQWKDRKSDNAPHLLLQFTSKGSVQHKTDRALADREKRRKAAMAGLSLSLQEDFDLGATAVRRAIGSKSTIEDWENKSLDTDSGWRDIMELSKAEATKALLEAGFSKESPPEIDGEEIKIMVKQLSNI